MQEGKRKATNLAANLVKKARSSEGQGECAGGEEVSDARAHSNRTAQLASRHGRIALQCIAASILVIWVLSTRSQGPSDAF